MLFHGWQIGLDIQHDAARVVAILRQRQGWQLRHWWHIPLPENTFFEGVLLEPKTLTHALTAWRQTLPRRHQIRVAFPTQRTLQRQIPAPDNRLTEPDRERYLTTLAAKQLQMSATQLSCDYELRGEVDAPLLVAAARQSDVAILLDCLSDLRLFPATLTPGACALPVIAQACGLNTCRYVIHQEQDHWLWATTQTRSRWGWKTREEAKTFCHVCQQLETTPADTAFSSAFPQPHPEGATPLDPLQSLRRLQPPLPPYGGLYTVALGLAVGRVNE